jgi:hypothetical protein
MFKLSEKGEDLAQDPHAVRDTDYRIASYMFMRVKPVELDDILDETHLSDEMGLKVMTRMVNGGYVEEM